MRSGNGRHRRPRQAPAFVVTAGVTGAGLTLPLLAASAAHAADSGTWDRVAQCESGGVWSANGGNGYYGGLQLTLKSWKAYGGTEYAARPDLASRSEQISVAEKILDALGPDAWPSCSMSSGLTDSSTQAPDVDPGLPGSLLGLPTSPSTDAPSPSTGSTGDDPSSSPTPAPSPSTSAASPTPDAPSDDSATPAPKTTTDAPDTPQDPPSSGDAGKDTAGDGAGRHRGSADTRGKDQDRSSRGRHGRDGLPGDTDGTHLVRPGDTLWSIAEHDHVHGGWPTLYAANRTTVGDDPDLILPGQVLHLTAHSAS
jgi:resuscitation-promoting factor RpfA